jgi:hypothetical protein
VGEAGLPLSRPQRDLQQVQDLSPHPALNYDDLAAAYAVHRAVHPVVLRRGGRICTVTDSPAIIRNREPLAVFFPESVTVDLARYPAPGELKRHMQRAGFEAVCDEEVELSHVTSDVEPYRARAFSCLHLIPEPVFRRGLARLTKQAGRGGVRCVSRYVLLWGTKR